MENIRFSLIILSLTVCSAHSLYAASSWVFVTGIKNDSPYHVRIQSTDPGSENRIDGRAYHKEPYILKPNMSVETRITVPWQQTYGSLLKISVLKDEQSMKEVSSVTLQDVKGKIEIRGNAYLKKSSGNLAKDRGGVVDKTKDIGIRIMKDGLVVIEQV